jgi:hypothetical protein
MIFFKKYVRHSYDCRCAKFDFSFVKVLKSVFQVNTRLRIQLFNYSTVLKIFDHKFADKFVFIRNVLALIINIFFNRSILSF